MSRLNGRKPVEYNINSPKQDHVPVYNETTRLWETVTRLSGSAQTSGSNTFFGNQTISGSLTVTGSFNLGGSTNINIPSSSNQPLVAVNSGNQNILNINGNNLSASYATYDLTSTSSYHSVDAYALLGNYVYTADGDQGKISIVDVSNPAKPVFISSITSSAYLAGPKTISAQGNYVYTTTRYNPHVLTVIDVSNVYSASIVSSISISPSVSTSQNLYVVGSYAYLVGGSILQIVDISNPTNLSIVSTTTDATNLLNASGIIVYQKTAYISSGYGNTLSIYDVSNPSTASFIGKYSSGSAGGETDLFIQGTHAYINASGTNTVSIIDISNKTSPSLISQYQNAETGRANTTGIWVTGQYIYSLSMGTINVADGSDLANPFLITSNTFQSGYQIRDFVINGSYLYTTFYSSGNVIFYTFDLAGIRNIPTAQIGSANIGDVNIKNVLRVGNTVNVGNSISVGSSGVYSIGSVISATSLKAPSITGSLFGTASFATNALTASYFSGSITNATSASYVLNAISASYAQTASYANNFTVAGTLTAQTIVAQTITSSIVYASGSNKFGNNLSNTHQFTGSVSITGSISLNGSAIVPSDQTSSMSVATASYAAYAVTASYVLNAVSASYSLSSSYARSASYANNATSASYSLSASYVQTSQTASYVLSSSYASNSTSASYVNALNQSVTITGSFLVSGSTTQIGNNTLQGNTVLSGSLTISGNTIMTGSITATNLTASFGYVSASYLEVTGKQTVRGYMQYLPTTDTVPLAVTGGYIYSSGSQGDLYFGQTNGSAVNVVRLRWIEGNLYSGLLSGGIIATGSSTIYTLSSGSGIIVSLGGSLSSDPYPTVQYLNWGMLSASIAPQTASYDQSFVGVYASGSTYVPKIIAQGTPFSGGQYDTLIPIGVVLHQNHSTINGLKTQPSLAYGWKQRSNIFIQAFGPLKLSGYPMATSSSLGVTVGSGTAFSDGANYPIDPSNPSYITDAGTAVSKIFRYWQSGSAWTYDTNGGTGYTTIDPGNYVSGSGVLTNISGLSGSNRVFTIQRVFWYPNSNTKAIVVYYGNATYPTLTDAISNIQIESFTEAPNTAANAIFLGSIIVRNDALFTTAGSYQLVPAGLFRSVGGQAGGGGTVVTSTLAGLSDVAISGQTNGQPLVWNNVSNRWVNSSTLTATLTGNASTATSATSASYATTASYVAGSVANATSASYAATASYVLNAISSSYANNSISSSYALTASYVSTAQPAFPFSGSAVITGSLNISGSSGTTVFSNNADTLILTGSATITGSLNVIGPLTAQTLVVQTITSSTVYSSGSNIFGNSLSNTHQFTGSVAITGSLTVNGTVINNLTSSNTVSASYATSASFATTASYVIGGGVSGNGFPFSGSAVITGSLNISGSAGTTLFSNNADTLVLTGSAIVTGSLTLTGSLNVISGGITGSLLGTSSYATNAVSASYAATASYVSTATPAFPYSGSAVITGSLIISSSTATAPLALKGTGSGVFTVDGTTGRLFQIDDSLSGSLFSVNTISGLPVIEAFSDNTVRIGKFGSKALYVSQSAVGIGKEIGLNGVLDVSGSMYVTGSLNVSGSINGSISSAVTASYASTFQIGLSQISTATVASSIVGSNNLFTTATGSFTSAFYKYTATNGANARAGEVMAIWNAGTTQFTDYSTIDIGNTSNVTASVSIVTSQVQFNVTTGTSGWSIKSQVTYL